MYYSQFFNLILFISFQTVNENSLKQLSSVIESLQQQRPIIPTTLPFYLRSKNENDVKTGKFTLVKIQLSDKDLRKTIVSILKACNLSTTFVDKIQEPPPDKTRKFWENYGKENKNNFSNLEDDPFFQSIFMRRQMDVEPDTFK